MKHIFTGTALNLHTTRWQRLFTLTAGFLLFTIIFIWITWPLAGSLHEGITASHRPENGGPRVMIPGDHLQLLYYFELAREFWAGTTPWFHNLYEFNLGDDSATRSLDAYYAPISWIYALGASRGHPAFGWNFASWISVLTGAAGLYMLSKRFSASPLFQLAAVLAAVSLPYRWITLLHGSPTGFAMAYVPWILWGVDVAIRDRSSRGGWLAGLFLLLSIWGDLHTFFFTVLFIIPWTVIVFFRQDHIRFSVAELTSLFRALIGILVFGVIALFQTGMTYRGLQDGSMQEGRTIHEILLYSPTRTGFMDWNPDNPHNIIYLGYGLLFLLLLVFATAWARRLTPSASCSTRHFVLYHCLLLILGGILLLALGPRMFPNGDIWWQRLCRIFPPYAMIRQPAKIFSVLPPFLLVTILWPLSEWKTPKSAKLGLLALFASFFALWDTARRIDPTISIIEQNNQAYATIGQHATAANRVPRAIAVVLWPGDSHWSSVNQVHAIQHRIRMVNGYRPHIPAGYVENVFYRYLGLNQGYASDDMLNELLGNGIHYLLIHEDAFPEKVSPFSVAITLDRFLEHPRVRLLKQDRSVWAFEILDEPDTEAVLNVPAMHAVGHAMYWDASHLPLSAGQIITDVHDAARQRILRLQAFDKPLILRPYATFYSEGLSMSLRIRGEGSLTFTYRVEPDEALEPAPLHFSSDHWEWISLPFPDFKHFSLEPTLSLHITEGFAEIDLVAMSQTPFPDPVGPGASVFYPARAFFRAGYSSTRDSSVTLEPDFVPADEVFYGLRIPLALGSYTLEFHYDSDAPTGTLLGVLRIREPHSGMLPEPVPVLGGQDSTTFSFQQEQNLPFILAFRFARTNALRIHGVTITKEYDL